MKKTLLFVLALCIGASTMAQQTNKFRIDTKSVKKSEAPAIGIEPVKSMAITNSDVQTPEVTTTDRDVNIVNIIDIGTSANAYGWGYAGGQKSLVWVDPDLNAVMSMHRMGGDLDPDGYSGDLGYDISLDGGATWTNMIECYTAVDNGGGEYFVDAARYPNAGIYNPTNIIDDAKVTFFAPNLEGTNDGWGGYSFGISDITDPSAPTYNRMSTHGDYYQYIPDAYEITSTGEIWVVDANQDWSSGSVDYQDNLLVSRGTWNGTDFEFTQSLLDFELIDQEDQARPTFIQVTFSEDGMTGYIVALGSDGSADAISGGQNIYPNYWKTTDGGDNWEGPFHVQLDGPNGIGGIVNNHLTDEAIAELFEAPVPSREEISYTTAFDMNCAVDNNGNLHIAIVIAPTGSDPYSITTAKGYIAAVDIFTADGGTTWYCEEMGRLSTFRGTFGTDYTEDNRIQITTNKDADMIFVSWLDTDVEDAEDNDRPNIWMRGFQPSTYMKTTNTSGEDAPTNVTLFSAGMWSSYFFIAPKWCFEDNGTFTIPMAYELGDPTDPGVKVQFKYISNFSFSMSDFTVQGVDETIEPAVTLSSVSQNFPNPFNNESYVTINLNEASNLSLEVYTLTGQLVSAKDFGYKTNGSHTITINASDLTTGIYFYTVTAGENKVTRKMIVE